MNPFLLALFGGHTAIAAAYEKLSEIVPLAAWDDTPLDKNKLSDLSSWWLDEYSKLKKETSDFKGSSRYNKEHAEAARDGIATNLALLAEQGHEGLTLEQLQFAIVNDMRRLIEALPSFDDLRKDKKLVDRVDKFEARCASLGKGLLLAGLRPAVPMPIKLAELKGCEHLATMQEWIGDLPASLKIGSTETGFGYLVYSTNSLRSWSEVLGRLSLDQFETLVQRAADARTRVLKPAQAGQAPRPDDCSYYLDALTELNGRLSELGSQVLANARITGEQSGRVGEVALLVVESLRAMYGARGPNQPDHPKQQLTDKEIAERKKCGEKLIMDLRARDDREREREREKLER